MATLLIVEDDLDTNEAVYEYLQNAGHHTISAFDGDEAITLFSENKIDLVILDIMLPTITGLAVLNSIRKTSQVPVLMLTAMEDESTQITSFDSMADDYMTKPFSMVILGKRITALLRRSNLAEKVDVWTYDDLTVNFSGYSVHNSSGELEVTAKELDLLKLLVEHQGLVLSRTQILDGVWGDNSYVLDRLVDTYYSAKLVNRSSAGRNDVVNYIWVMKSEPQIYCAIHGRGAGRTASTGAKRADPGISDQTRPNTDETG